MALKYCVILYWAVFISHIIILLTQKKVLKDLLAVETDNIKVIPEHSQTFARIKMEFRNSLSRNQIRETKLSIPNLIRKHGYPCEIHKVETTDGYILETHRIPHGIGGPSEHRPAVLLQHGLLGSSSNWIVAGPGKGFAYILVDRGYDVWMPNARGTGYSRKHKTLDPDEDDEDFWNFSWHEIAIYDVAANMDYIIAATNQYKIYYIGHSQGTTVFYVLCAEKPEYNDKVRAMFSLAPIGYMYHITSPLMNIFGNFLGSYSVTALANWIGPHEFLPHSGLLSGLTGTLCRDGSAFQILCTNPFFVIGGFNKDQINASLLPLIMAHGPSGISSKQILHYAQEIKSGYFRQYDYGKRKNKKIYGSKSPPNYKLKNINAPVYFYYSESDWMANPKDVKKLYKELSNPQGLHLISDRKFKHVDFIYGKNAPQMLYNEIMMKMMDH